MYNSSVSVVIATTCEARRRQSLMNAVDSVLAQEGVSVKVIAVVNGDRVDEDCLSELQNRPGVQVVREVLGSYPYALQIGRINVDTPFFAFLDDDDEYLPSAIKNRLAPLLSDPSLTFVASNGWRRLGGMDQAVVKNTGLAQRSPLVALARENWLASCGGMFRTSAVGSEYFDGRTAHLEWTFIAYKLALSHRSEFVDIPTFVINDSAGSLSKSDGYAEAEGEVLPKILALNLPKAVRRDVQEKLGRCLHNIAARKSANGDWWHAWRLHVASILCRGGWRYLLYSRKLVLPMRRRV
ncbi:glycosyltransferase family 2 protein [Massilia sp. PAMC28688]|nr:glycosyltransferase family 2 protein [Massilia sp. PAMC28688]